jgi:hypothetical protein
MRYTPIRQAHNAPKPAQIRVRFRYLKAAPLRAPPQMPASTMSRDFMAATAHQWLFTIGLTKI